MRRLMLLVSVPCMAWTLFRSSAEIASSSSVRVTTPETVEREQHRRSTRPGMSDDSAQR